MQIVQGSQSSACNRLARLFEQCRCSDKMHCWAKQALDICNKHNDTHGGFSMHTHRSQYACSNTSCMLDVAKHCSCSNKQPQQ